MVKLSIAEAKTVPTEKSERKAPNKASLHRNQLPSTVSIDGHSGPSQPGSGERLEKDRRVPQSRFGMRTFGTDDEDVARTLSYQLANATPGCSGDGVRDLSAAFKTMQDIAPRDALERLLVTQMMSLHNMAMECFKRALFENQTSVGVDTNINRAIRLIRTFATLMDALNRHRGKVTPMVVGSVNISDGGQAIVGPVSHAISKDASADKNTVEEGAKVE